MGLLHGFKVARRASFHGPFANKSINDDAHACIVKRAGNSRYMHIMNIVYFNLYLFYIQVSMAIIYTHVPFVATMGINKLVHIYKIVCTI
jgi:hypothetical protein